MRNCYSKAMVKKCPYCFEDLAEKPLKCPQCNQYLIDGILEVDYHGVEKKNCIFCGKKILVEAKICKYCHKWLDEIDRAADDLRHMEE